MVESIFEDVHSQRLDALANYSEATIHAMRAGISAIGAAHAETRDIEPRHGLEQFDRFLGNGGSTWRSCVLRGRASFWVAAPRCSSRSTGRSSTTTITRLCASTS